MEFSDLELARQLQEQFDRETASSFSSPTKSNNVQRSSKSPLSIVDQQWELTDPNPDIRALFLQYNDRFFWGRLAGIEVKWSPRMTLCAGVCVYEGRSGLCSVRLSTPLLKLRPRKDLVETLLHEMIHAYLFVTQNNKDHDGHGPEFQKHMNRINKETGTNISIYHNFHDEVAAYRQHWWRCDGPCRSRPPYFGYVKRAMNRAPAPRDTWWGEHQRSCGGTFTKVKEPDGYGQKKSKKEKEEVEEKDNKVQPKNSGPDIRSFWGSTNNANTSKVQGGKKKPSSTVTSNEVFPKQDEPRLPNLPGFSGDSSEASNNSRNKSATSTSNNSSDTFPSGVSWKPAPKPTIKTIWDSETPSSSKPAGKPSSNGPHICDINSVDNFNSVTETQTFEGQGHTLGSSQGQGLSFLAQLRREMKAKNSSDKTTKPINTPSPTKGISRTDSPKKNIDDNNANYRKSLKTNSPQKEDWKKSPQIKSRLKTESPLKNKDKHKNESPRKNVIPSPQKSLTDWFSPSSSQSSHSVNSPGAGAGAGSSNRRDSSDIVLSDNDDFTSPRKPLFKKVNPASNFTSPPNRRISLFNTDSPTKDLTAGTSKSKSNDAFDSEGLKKNQINNGKRKISSVGDSERNRLKSWTRQRRYSSSDDDIEEIKQPSKKFKPNKNVKGTKTHENVSGKSKNKSGNVQSNNATGVSETSQPIRGDNSSDPLQSCPVCQTRVVASQINAHLDVCLSLQ